MGQYFKDLGSKVNISPLVIFRIGFGLLMTLAVIRFWLNGWITDFYIKPTFYFSYFGFEWIKPLGYVGTHFLFASIALSAFFIAIGLFYRLSTIIFFVSFTYAELMDKTNYLNHYYFVSLIGFLLCFVPANRFFSLDGYFFPKIKSTLTPKWSIEIFKWQISIVYFFAGIAKINTDWLLEAMPLSIWLHSKTDFPILGYLFQYQWVAYLFSWAGMIFDISIPFLLFQKKTRVVAYYFVVVFHLLTWLLFPIGIFPFVMMLATLVFFDFNILDNKQIAFNNEHSRGSKKLIWGIIGIYFLLQILLPLRFLLYPGKLFWTEQGYRFSWRVMLIEKMGFAKFYITDSQTGRTEEVKNNRFLTPLQEKMMSTQPDMMLQYAHYLKDEYLKQGWSYPQVKVESYAVLNGQGSRQFIEPEVDLAKEKISLAPKSWILPYE